MKAKCPYCAASGDPVGCTACCETGFIQLSIKEGDCYTLKCDTCGRQNGIHIVDHGAPEPPLDEYERECVWCNSPVRQMLLG